MYVGLFYGSLLSYVLDLRYGTCAQMVIGSYTLSFGLWYWVSGIGPQIWHMKLHSFFWSLVLVCSDVCRFRV